MAWSVKHEEALSVDVGQATRVWNSKLGWVWLFPSGRNVAASWQSLVTDEVTGNWTDKEDLLLHLLFRVEAEIDEYLRVVIGHSLQFGVNGWGVETIELDIWILLKEVENGFSLNFRRCHLPSLAFKPTVFDRLSTENN